MKLLLWIIIFSILTGLLLISHISEKVTYINNQSNSDKHEIGGEGFNSTIYFNVIGKPNKVVFHFNFNSVLRKSIIVEELQVEIPSGSFEKIECYNGMNITPLTPFKNFSEIPLSQRTLTSSKVDPYYTFDFYYALPENTDEMIVDIRLKYQVDEKVFKIIDSYTYQVETDWSISPLDNHSDITYLLILPSASILVILIIIGLIKYFRRRSLEK